MSINYYYSKLWQGGPPIPFKPLEFNLIYHRNLLWHMLAGPAVRTVKGNFVQPEYKWKETSEGCRTCGDRLKPTMWNVPTVRPFFIVLASAKFRTGKITGLNAKSLRHRKLNGNSHPNTQRKKAMRPERRRRRSEEKERCYQINFAITFYMHHGYFYGMIVVTKQTIALALASRPTIEVQSTRTSSKCIVLTSFYFLLLLDLKFPIPNYYSAQARGREAPRGILSLTFTNIII